jgi:hypothetical protein
MARFSVKKGASPTPEFVEKVECIVGFAFNGMHHVKSPTFDSYSFRCNFYGDLSSWDNNALTRLVIAAHEHCVRASVEACNMQMLRIVLSPRKPIQEAGDYPGMCGHPTLQEHLGKLHMSPWRSMDSAPRDGTEVLVALAPFGGVTAKKVVRFLGGYWRAIEVRQELVLPESLVQFWMPIPAVPAVQEVVRG